MKKYIASYEDNSGNSWTLTFYAHNYAAARKEARAHEGEMGKLFSFRSMKTN